MVIFSDGKIPPAPEEWFLLSRQECAVRKAARSISQFRKKEKLGGMEPARKTATLKKLIIEFLKTHPGTKSVDIATGLGLTVQQVQKTLVAHRGIFIRSSIGRLRFWSFVDCT